MKSTSRFIFVIVILGLIAFAWFKISGKKEAATGRRQSTPTVLVETPLRRDVEYNIAFTGDIKPDRQIGIYSKIGGTLERLGAEVGDRVRAGRLLALIDTTELIQQVNQSAATYLQAKTAADRAKDLFAQNLVSQLEFDNAATALAVATANYNAAKLRLDFATITAPFDGVISKRFLDVGALVSPNNALIYTLIDFDTVKVSVEVLERDIPKIARNMEATVTVDAWPGEKFHGTVQRISESVNLNTRTMEVEVDVPNRDFKLKPGMFASISILLDIHPNAITIPGRSMLKDDEGYFAWTVKNGEAFKQRVEPGTVSGTRYEVISGLSDSDSIITDGIQMVRPGVKVNIKSKG